MHEMESLDLQRYTETILRLAKHEATEAEDLSAAVAHITEAAAEALAVARVGIWMYTPGRDGLRCLDLFRSAEGRHESGTMLRAQDVPAYFAALEEDRAIAAHDAHLDPRTSEFSETYLTPLSIGAMLDSPIRRGGSTVGVVCHEHVGGARTWTVGEQVFAGSIGDLVAYAIEQYERQGAEAERSRLEDQLRHAQKMEAIGRLAGGIAHDFNNLLTVIQGSADLLRSVVPDRDGAPELLDEIRSSAVAAQLLTRELLTFSRKREGAQVVLDLGATVRDRAGILRRLIGEDVELEIDLADASCCVRADPSRLEQILLNLCANARDAMPGGGHLTISVQPVDGLPLECAADSSDAGAPHVRLSVCDDGVGMRAEERERIFEPFFTTKAQGLGTGLGLASVYGIVGQHGGAIHVESAPGEGACFHVYLPLAEGEPAPVPAEPAWTKRSLEGLAVLVVEDQPQIRDVIGLALEAVGCRVTAAAGPDEALHLVREEGARFVVLITDIVMPGMDGWRLAREMLVLMPDLAVVCMSGYAQETRGPMSELAGRVQFLAKPFRPRTLIETIQAALEMS